MKKLLLHICCGPCGTHPATLLAADYEIVGYFYNSNIWPYEEWVKRYQAFEKFCKENSAIADYFPKNILSAEEYLVEHEKYLKAVYGLEKEPEGGARCAVCFRLRLEGAAKFAKSGGFGIFATTLTIGRNKRPEIINPIGVAAGEKYGVKFFEANFKKQDGALKGKKISDEHGLYRQHYCGCEWSIPSERGG
jgi:hypothetical protein